MARSPALTMQLATGRQISIRDWTVCARARDQRNSPYVAVAIAAAEFDRFKSLDLQTYFTWQLLRTSIAYGVSEIVIYADNVKLTEDHPAYQFANLLMYLDTPPGLRRLTMPKHKLFRACGHMPELEAPHHSVAKIDNVVYAEGVVLAAHSSAPRAKDSANEEEERQEDRRKAEGSKRTRVLIGATGAEISIRPDSGETATPPEGTRVTLKITLDEKYASDVMRMAHETESKSLERKLLLSSQAVSNVAYVGPDEPRREHGIYWGVSVRVVSGPMQIWTESPLENGYSCTVMGVTSTAGARIACLHVAPDCAAEVADNADKTDEEEEHADESDVSDIGTKRSSLTGCSAQQDSKRVQLDDPAAHTSLRSTLEGSWNALNSRLKATPASAKSILILIPEMASIRKLQQIQAFLAKAASRGRRNPKLPAPQSILSLDVHPNSWTLTTESLTALTQTLDVAQRELNISFR